MCIRDSGTAGNTFSQFLQEDLVRYKKYFYALRPLLAGRYILEHRCPPPVLFDDLMKMEMPVDLRAGIEELLEIKKKSGESPVSYTHLDVYKRQGLQSVGYMKKVGNIHIKV